jgi:hypothetical protein
MVTAENFGAIEERDKDHQRYKDALKDQDAAIKECDAAIKV